MESDPIKAIDFVEYLINTQRHRNPADDATALIERFNDHLVVNHYAEPYAPDDIVMPDDDIWFYRMPAAERPIPYKIHTIFEDDDLLVIDKPPYLATMPRGRHITETALVKMRVLTGNNDLTPAHRLDRLTAGVLVMVKKPELRGAYQTLFARREASKTYEAIAEYIPNLMNAEGPTIWENRIEKERGVVQAFVTEGPVNARTELVSVTPVNDAEQKILEATHGSLPRQARYVLAPATGKTHQLRLHMRDFAAPILGDPLYPVLHAVDDEDYTTPMHLIARTLTFIDPQTHEERTFVSTRPTGSL
ncbi:ribosomal pseudouridine synthase [Corynebacterium deserti GIMN1.010]|uniref:RNA pseudouridylate synthase n=2 Tax=Corynebacterium TaxID=1716 RepID=A0A0M4CFP8_9CORY|nr:ribosomal pseudouridine synthase [Corynebacterium deserti GIMN1.010]